MQVATTQIIKVYFPGRQAAPFGAICLTMNSAAVAFPLVWEQLMELLGWHLALIAIGQSFT